MTILQDLIIGVNDSASASGFVVESRDEFGLLTTEEIAAPGTVSLDQDSVIRLFGFSHDHKQWLKKRIGRRVKLSGRWTGANLALDIDSARLEELLQPSIVSQGDEKSSIRDVAPRPRPSSHAYDVENALRQSGALLSIWKPAINGGEEVAFAIATDVALVSRTLGPIYGNSLQVVRSRWSSETLDGLRQVFIRAPEGIVLSLGESHTDDHQIEILARLRYLPREVADSLSQYPMEAVDLTVVIQPVYIENRA